MQPTTVPSRGVGSRAVRASGAAVGGTALVVLAGWLTWRLPGSRGFSDVAAPAVAALATLAAAVAGRRGSGRVRRAWLLLAGGAAVAALALAYWAVDHLAGRSSVPNRVSATLFVVFTLVELAGLLQLPARRLDRGGLLRLGLDVLMVGTALTVAAWALVVAPGLAGDDGGAVVRDYGVPYTVAAVLTLAVTVLVAARAAGRWLVPMLLVCGGLALIAVGRLTMVGLLVRDGYAAGGPLDLCWIAGLGLLAAAALWPPAAQVPAVLPATTAERGIRARVLLPYLPVVVALIAAAAAGPGLRGPGLVLGSVAVIVLLLARQVLTALDNAAFAAEETRMAYSDPLTGLGNRALLAAEVARAQRAARGGDRLSLLLLDLDGFKAVNDSLGHEAGDRLLVQLAQRLTATVGPDDVVARLGGDEFAVLVEAAAPGAGLRTARRLLDALGAPVDFSGRTVRVTVSIGVVEQVGGDTGDVLRDADVAMYAAKSAGKACVRQFEPAMRRAVMARAELEADLRHALDRGEFSLRFQPVVDLDSREIRGAEALVRWRHPRRGLLAPDSFIPLAAEIGLIGELDQWVMEEACRVVAGWQPLRPGFTVSVNVTADRFASTDLVGAVAEALAETGLPPQCLTVELTETALVADAEATISRLGALGALGVQVAIDDFGTGYSSLAYLHRLPASILKIDKSFVEGLGTNAESTALVRVIMGLAETFGLRTVAEGVETESQRALLRALGCTTAQGYLFAPPLEQADLEALLAGPARGVGAARIREDDPAADEPPPPPLESLKSLKSPPPLAPLESPAPLPELPAPLPALPVEPAEDPAPRGVGAARLRLLADPPAEEVTGS